MRCLVCDLRDDHETEDCPHGTGLDPLFDEDSSEYGRPETGRWKRDEEPEEVAWSRAETDPCERGTPGCSVRHTRDSECQTW